MHHKLRGFFFKAGWSHVESLNGEADWKLMGTMVVNCLDFDGYWGTDIWRSMVNFLGLFFFNQGETGVIEIGVFGRIILSG